ncbi:phage late control protein D [Leptospira noguchii]|uniref:Phage late control protein D domain protein n=1 Tax=Leptospira noguchii TaxID=28182 RepID=M6VLD7_9LEPT|nr:phage late control protein D [Leptospira noguchii]EMO53894.1 phage late control protein D domain protein [Leptospira noguchii]
MILPGPKRQYYFKIKALNPKFTDLEYKDSDIGFNILSFSVEEEMFANTLIDLTIKDNVGLDTKIFSRGQKFSVEWGLDASSDLPGFLDFGADEIRGSFKNLISCAVVNTSNGYFQGGSHIRKIELRVGKFAGRPMLTKEFNTGTVEDAIRTIANLLDFKKVDISFPRQGELLTRRNPLVQARETNFQFIRRQAEKYGCVVYSTRDDKGTEILHFRDTKEVHEKSKQELVNREGQYHILNYGNDQSNIVGEPSYDLGPGSSLGSSTSITLDQNGRMVATFQASETESTISQVINMKAVQDDADKGDMKAYNLVMNASFEEFIVSDGKGGEKIGDRFKKYFTDQKNSTMPEQNGWTFRCSTVPNPLYKIGDRVHLGPTDEKGWCVIPPDIRSCRKNAKAKLWRLAKHIWTHDASGVKQDLELKR